MWVSSVAFSTYFDKDSEVGIPPCAVSWLRDDLEDLNGTMFPELPRPQGRLIPSHTHFVLFILEKKKKVLRRDTLLL